MIRAAAATCISMAILGGVALWLCYPDASRLDAAFRFAFYPSIVFGFIAYASEKVRK